MTYKLRIDPYYYIDNHNLFTWKINYQYNHFKDLNDIINNIGNNYIHSEFPINYRKTSIGLKLTSSKLEERRYMLEMWIKELLANYCNLPYLIKSNIENFIDIPHDIEKRYHSYLSTIQVATKLGLHKCNNNDNSNNRNSNNSSPINNNGMDANSIRNNIVNIIQSNSNTPDIDTSKKNTIVHHYRRHNDTTTTTTSRLPSPLALKIRSILQAVLDNIGISSSHINPYYLPKLCRTETFIVSASMTVVDTKHLSLVGHVALGTIIIIIIININATTMMILTLLP